MEIALYETKPRISNVKQKITDVKQKITLTKQCIVEFKRFVDFVSVTYLIQ